MKKIRSLIKIKKNRNLLIVALGVLVILIPIVYLTLKSPVEAEAAWFNDSWGYRIKTIISNAGSVQTDFQVSIALDTSALVTAGKMQTNCDDLRVTDVNGKLTDFWLDSCNNTGSNIWIKIASVPTTDLVYYVYYGNDAASNGETVGDITHAYVIVVAIEF